MTDTAPALGACLFDAYGTLLDINAAAEECRSDLGDQADAFSATWRTRQVQYTWLRSMMGQYAEFWQVTGEALDYALAAHGFQDPGLRARLMELYLRLNPYPDAAATLAALRARGMRTAILSNGTPTMLAAAVDSGQLGHLLDAVISVDTLRIYKPHPSVYQLGCDRLDLPKEQIAFVSGNGWDAAGAAAFGFHVVWLNRAGVPIEQLPAKPATIIETLAELPAALGL